VSDNGKGFSPEAVQDGVGIKNLRERAETLKAKLNIHSAPNEGTLVSLAMPLTSSQSAQTAAQT
jgi:signal transduction histidine kinase